MPQLCVLFVCTQNAGRSQMAAALAETIGGDRIIARSAGSRPAAAVHRNVAAVMQEIGIDIAARCPTALTPQVLREADIVVEMGCGDDCPPGFSGQKETWHLDDPDGRSPDDVRRIRDDVRARVEELLLHAVLPADT